MTSKHYDPDPQQHYFIVYEKTENDPQVVAPQRKNAQNTRVTMIFLDGSTHNRIALLRKHFTPRTPGAPIVCSCSDALIAAVVTRIMMLGRLNEFPFFIDPLPQSAIAQQYWGAARPLAQTALVTNLLSREMQLSTVPLIRDEIGTVLLGPAIVHISRSSRIRGETYVDERRLDVGNIRTVVMMPTVDPPGLKARLDRPILPRRWSKGRACQIGAAQKISYEAPGVSPAGKKRLTLYRHTDDLRVLHLVKNI